MYLIGRLIYGKVLNFKAVPIFGKKVFSMHL